MSDPFVDHMRAVIRQAQPEGSFLRRDRGEALFVTDASRRGRQIDWREMGFICSADSGLDHLTPDTSWLDALISQYPEPPDPFCRTFRRFDGPPDAAALALFARGLKILDGAPWDPGFEKALRQSAAVALRAGGGGGLYACSLLKHRMEVRI